MKDKKNNENVKETRAYDSAVDNAQELDEDDLEKVAGGVGSPFDRPRMGYQPIDDDLRNNG